MSAAMSTHAALDADGTTRPFAFPHKAMALPYWD